MPREGIGMSTIVIRCNRQLYYCSKYPTYYAQCYRKLRYNAVMHSTIVLLLLKCIALHKGPGLQCLGQNNLLDSLLLGLLLCLYLYN